MAAARRARSIVNDFSFLIVLFFISASFVTDTFIVIEPSAARPPGSARRAPVLRAVRVEYIRRGSVCYVSLG